MLVIVSTPAIREKFIHVLPGFITVDHWIAVRQIPYENSRIEALLRKKGLEENQGSLIFLVNSRKRVPADFPGLFAGKWLISLIFYKNVDELQNWMNALEIYAGYDRQKVIVMGMMKPFYMMWANRLYDCIRKVPSLAGHTNRHLADTTIATQLAGKLSRGCSLAIYVGHGRSRGWSGYRGFRWSHMAAYTQRSPVGTLISFSCSGLKKDRKDAAPFSLQWIISGRACASLATCGSLKLRPLEKIGYAFMESMALPEVTKIDQLLRSMNDILDKLEDTEVKENWHQFRLTGNPQQPIK